MKQRLMVLFSALLIMLSSVGAASAIGDNLTVDIKYNGFTSNETGFFKPGDVVNITADFNQNVTNATISINKGSPRTVVSTPNVNLVGAGLVTDEPMELIGPNDLGGNSFGIEFPMPEDILTDLLGMDISALDIDGEPVGDEDGSFSYPDMFAYPDPYIDIISPESDFVGKSCVKFNFSAFDYLSDEITYTFSLDGIVKSSGTITSGEYKQLEFELAEGIHTWEVKTKDSQGPHTSGPRTLYVDTKCPTVKLIAPQGCYKEIIGSTDFKFVCEDALAVEHDLDLTYTLYIDGKPAADYTDIPGYTPGSGYEDGSEQIPWNDIFPDGISWEELFPGVPLEELFPDIPVDTIPENGIPEDGIPEDLWDDLFPEDVISGKVKCGEPVSKKLALSDGAHNWSVLVEDGAGNKATSEVRDFYVSLDGFRVTLDSPNGGYVSSNPTFIFTVEGARGKGVGLPFHYKLLIDGKEVDAKCEKKKVCTAGCTEGDCCEDGFVVGEDNYSIKAAVPDGLDKTWTVIITDCTSGKTFKPARQPLRFSVDSVAPACVANLNVVDAPGVTDWTSTRDYPGLMVSWNASTDADLADEPYEVYISTSKPGCIEDMQKVRIDGGETHTDGTLTPNQRLRYSQDESLCNLCIEALEGKDLVYGKDYWVAVIARDKAGNYNSAFSVCGPIQTYEDMNIMLEQGWNLKSVPKKLVESKACPESVFGEDSIVIYWDGACWQCPDTIEPCKGYWVYAKEPCMTNAKFKGMSVDGANPDVPASLVLKPGWQMIGHTSAYAAPWSITLASLNDFNTDFTENYKFSSLITYNLNEGWGGIITAMADGRLDDSMPLPTIGANPEPVKVLQSYDYMVPGQGYWIFVKNGGTYASIENTYNLDLMYENGGLPDNFNPDDQDTWPEDFPSNFDLNDQDTWPDGYENYLNEFLNGIQ